ncbi:unnamed protein product [Closterium sp. NIES-65]|nr:unnamed protein product [Closterium sp. NIES-65]
MASSEKVLRTDTMNENVLKTVYAVRGELYLRAAQLQAEGKEIIFTNVGNPHSLGQKPMTFPRLVLALAEAPFLMENPETAKLFPADAIARAKKYLSFTTGGIGAYSDSRGLAGIRKEVAEFIAKRDGFPSDPDKIYLTDGASKGVERMLNVLIRNEKDGILCPIPQYPLYSASIALLGGTLVPYYLDESQGWGLDMAELKQSCEDARQKGTEVRVGLWWITLGFWLMREGGLVGEGWWAGRKFAATWMSSSLLPPHFHKSPFFYPPPRTHPPFPVTHPGGQVRCLVFINPGNPTGNCLSEENLKELVKFCVDERLVLLADEVYQENVYQDERPFLSAKKVRRGFEVARAVNFGLERWQERLVLSWRVKTCTGNGVPVGEAFLNSEEGDLNACCEAPQAKVAMSMGEPYASSLELVSFHTVSKGTFGECGQRGGYMEVFNIDEGVCQELYKMSSISLCPNLCGQLMVGLMVNPPAPGDASYEEFTEERSSRLASLRRRAHTVTEGFNSCKNVTCNFTEGAMYSFPRINLPEKALEAAKAAGKAADVFYCLRLLEVTGITAVPGSGFGQKEGTFHLRTTILPSEEKIPEMMAKFKKFNDERGASAVRRALSGGPNRNRDEKNDPGKVIEFSGSDDSDAEAATKEKSTGQLDDIGAELARLRQERAAAETAAKADEGIGGFWRGVMEETQMIQWPAFTSVLGTTGVVVVVIVSSAVVLLTVNALLANFSDALFELPAVREVWHLSGLGDVVSTILKGADVAIAACRPVALSAKCGPSFPVVSAQAVADVAAPAAESSRPTGLFAAKDLAAVTGQRPVVTRARKAIAGFKLRAGVPVGMATTLRGQFCTRTLFRNCSLLFLHSPPSIGPPPPFSLSPSDYIMYAYLDRLINLALPRMRDFRGVSRGGFDGRGNYSMGLAEQTLYPEIRFDEIDKTRGMDISIVTTAKTDGEAQRLLELLGVPFREGPVPVKEAKSKGKGRGRGRGGKQQQKSKKRGDGDTENECDNSEDEDKEESGDTSEDSSSDDSDDSDGEEGEGEDKGESSSSGESSDENDNSEDDSSEDDGNAYGNQAGRGSEFWFTFGARTGMSDEGEAEAEAREGGARGRGSRGKRKGWVSRKEAARAFRAHPVAHATRKFGRFSESDRCHLAQSFLPCDGPMVVDKVASRAYIGQFSGDGDLFVAGFQHGLLGPMVVDKVASRAYIGQFSGDRDLFVAGFQDRRIRVYDVDRGWALRKDVIARNLRWTITDTALSPDQRFLVYASITPIVHLVNVGYGSGEVESLANVTDIHEELNFTAVESRRRERSFGIWSLQFSSDGRELIAGSSDRSLYVFDLERNQPILRVKAHQDDVNAVAFADETSQLIYSGSDDRICKVWDRRLLDNTEPIGPLRLLDPVGPPPFSHSAGGAASAAGSAAAAAAGAGTGAGAAGGASGGGGSGGGGERQGVGCRNKPVGVLVGHTEGITHLASKGDARCFLTNGKDQTMKLWDIRTSQKSLPTVETSQKSLPTVETSQKSLPTVETSQKSLPTVETSQKSLPTVEASQKSLPTVETSQKSLPTVEASQKSLPTVETSQKSLPTVETSQKSLPTVETSQKSLPTVETSQKSLPTVETSQKSLPTVETSQKSLPTVETSQKSLPTVETSQKSLPTVETSQKSLPTVETSQKSLPTVETSQKSLPTVETSQKSLPTVETSQKSLPTVETSQKSLPTVETSQKSLPTVEASQKSLPTVETSQKSLPTVETSQKSLPTVETSQKSLPTVETSQKSLPTVETSQKSLPTVETSQKSLPTVETSQKSLPTVETSQKSLPTVETSQKSLPTVETSQKSLPTVETSQKSLPTVETSQKSLPTVETSQKSLPTVETSQKSLPTVETSQKSLPTVETSQKSLPTVEASQKSLPTVETSQKSLPTVETSQKSLPTVETSQKSLPTVETSQKSLPTVETSQKSLPTVETSQKSLPTVETSQKSLPTVETSQKSLPTVETSQKSLPTVETSQKSLPTVETSQKSLPTVETSQKSLPTVEASQKSLPTVETSQKSLPTVETSQNVSKSLPTVETSQKSLPTVETSQKSLPTVETSQKSLPTVETSQKSLPTVETSQKSLPTVETSQKSLPTVETSQKSLPTVETSQKSLPTVETSQKSLPTVETSQKSLPTVETSQKSLPTVETSQKSLPTVETSQKSLPTVETSQNLPPPRIPFFQWDYRWMDYPGRGMRVAHPSDQSLMTYRNHHVLQTLIRCYFSPLHSTAQRFVYSGSHDGAVYIFDLLTGKQVAKLKHHGSTVRDCSWHPTRPALASVGWDGKVALWESFHGETPPECKKMRQIPVTNHEDLFDE